MKNYAPNGCLYIHCKCGKINNVQLITGVGRAEMDGGRLYNLKQKKECVLVGCDQEFSS